MGSFTEGSWWLKYRHNGAKRAHRTAAQKWTAKARLLTTRWAKKRGHAVGSLSRVIASGERLFQTQKMSTQQAYSLTLKKWRSVAHLDSKKKAAALKLKRKVAKRVALKVSHELHRKARKARKAREARFKASAARDRIRRARQRRKVYELQQKSRKRESELFYKNAQNKAKALSSEMVSKFSVKQAARHAHQKARRARKKRWARERARKRAREMRRKARKAKRMRERRVRRKARESRHKATKRKVEKGQKRRKKAREMKRKAKKARKAHEIAQKKAKKAHEIAQKKAKKAHKIAQKKAKKAKATAHKKAARKKRKKAKTAQQPKKQFAAKVIKKAKVFRKQLESLAKDNTKQRKAAVAAEKRKVAKRVKSALRLIKTLAASSSQSAVIETTLMDGAAAPSVVKPLISKSARVRAKLERGRVEANEKKRVQVTIAKAKYSAVKEHTAKKIGRAKAAMKAKAMKA